MKNIIFFRYHFLVKYCVVTSILTLLVTLCYGFIDKDKLNYKDSVQCIENNNEDDKPILLGTSLGYPLNYNMSDGSGINGDIIKEVFKIIDSDYYVIDCQWIRCEILLKKGDIWGIFPYSITEKRKENYLFSDVLGKTNYKFFYYNDNSKTDRKNYNEIQDLSKLDIGTIAGAFYEDKLIEMGIELYNANDIGALFEKLVRGEINFVVFNEVAAWDHIKKNYPNEVNRFDVLDFNANTDLEAKKYIMVSKDYPNAEEILKKFNRGLKIIKENGTMDEILKKYDVEDYITFD